MARQTLQPSIDPAACQMLDVADAMGLSTAFSRAAAQKPCPIGSGQVGYLLQELLHGPLPSDQRRPGRHLRRVHRHDCRPQPGSGRRRRRSRPLRSRPRPGLHPASRRRRRGAGLRDPRRAPSCWRWPPSTASPPRAATTQEIARDLADKAIGEFGQQRGELSYISTAPAKRQKIWRDPEGGAAWHRPRGRRNPAPHAHGRRPGCPPHHAERCPHGAGGWLGRLDVGHRHLRHPVRHPVAQGGFQSTWACCRTTRSTSSSTATSPP